MSDWLVHTTSDGPLPTVVLLFGTDPAPPGDAAIVRVDGGSFTVRYGGHEQRASIGAWCSVGGLRVSVQRPSGGGGEIAAVDLVTTGAGGARTERVRLPTHDGGELVVGRDKSSTDLQVSDAHVSRSHLRIRRVGAKYMLEDLGSRWGTRLNGRELTTPVALADGDEITFGKSKLVFVSRGGESAPGPRSRASASDIRSDTQATMRWQPPG